MTIQTISTYWDCECRENYIHHKNLNRCRLCGALRLESPDSRVDEVRKYLTDHFIKKEPIEKEYIGVAMDIHYNGGRHMSTQIVPQDAPYYNPIEALEKIMPYLKTLHNVVRITFRTAYRG